MSRFESGGCTEEKLVRGQERHPDGLGVRPVRIVGELHTHVEILPRGVPPAINLEPVWRRRGIRSAPRRWGSTGARRRR
jgi:hypothetical protein